MLHALLIIAPTGFQDHEYDAVRTALEAADFDIVVASQEVGPCTGKFGGAVMATQSLEDSDPAEFDCTVFIGGPGARVFADDPVAHRMARTTLQAGKILGAICIAPTILATAGVLQGKRATVWDSGGEQAAILTHHGAVYTGEPVTVDGRIVTANGPDAAEEFGRTIVSLCNT